MMDDMKCTPRVWSVESDVLLIDSLKSSTSAEKKSSDKE